MAEKQEFELVAKTFKGLETVLANELNKLGAKDVKILNRAVSYTGNKALMYKSNLYLRTALKVIWPSSNCACASSGAPAHVR